MVNSIVHFDYLIWFRAAFLFSSYWIIKSNRNFITSWLLLGKLRLVAQINSSENIWH